MLDKSVFHPVNIKDLSLEEKKNIIRSSMFVKEKFLSNGDFDKLKARLVGGGDQQNRSDYDIDLLSSTAARDQFCIHDSSHSRTTGKACNHGRYPLSLSERLDEENRGESTYAHQ